MSKVSQKSAVFAAIMSVFESNNVQYNEGQDVGPLMTRELRGQVNNILFEGFKGGTIELSDEASGYSDSELKSYVSGLQSNWIRKDKNLNGGIKYVAKNPGSRVGQGDAQLKALKALITTKTDAAEVEEIQGYIDAREAELKTTKTAKSVDFSALPEALRSKYSA